MTLEVPYSVNIAHPTVLPEVEFPEPEPPKERFYTVAVKTNLLYDAVTALNAEVEFPVGKNFSVMVEDVFPWWNWGAERQEILLPDLVNGYRAALVVRAR